jgi:hypothetical protein
LEISWNVNVLNGLAWFIWTFETQVMAKRRVRNHSNFLTCKWRVTYRWKALDKGYNFTLDLISIGGLHAKLWAMQSCGSLSYENFRTPTWESWDKIPFGCRPREEAQNIL